MFSLDQCGRRGPVGELAQLPAEAVHERTAILQVRFGRAGLLGPQVRIRILKILAEAEHVVRP